MNFVRIVVIALVEVLAGCKSLVKNVMTLWSSIARRVKDDSTGHYTKTDSSTSNTVNDPLFQSVILLGDDGNNTCLWRVTAQQALSMNENQWRMAA